MLTLTNIREWLEGMELGFDFYYEGKLDSKKEKSLGVYQLETSNVPHVALGGLANTRYKTKPISLLVHWDMYHDHTEKKALELYSKLERLEQFNLNDTRVYYVELLNNEPVDVHTDDTGIYERVIQLIIYYERKEA
ncbi:hypothetical protein A4S06_05370 [Erysipelotrichaceae bacterium MTC7]|nr:hypothetical protein A4S06_05370 [Erysipelotrichaceae bacterium MTC7]